MLGFYLLSVLSLGTASQATAYEIQYAVPAVAPANAAQLDATPVGVSFEFFMWPSYMTNITPPLQCIDHFSELYKRKMPFRIGGTTQDRATYDPDFRGYVSYTTPDPLEAPMELTYGPRFFDLIGKFKRETILGFNRGDNNRTNTYQAILAAKSRVLKWLWAIELGNEPDFYYTVWKKPVATPPWNYTQEGADAADWAQGFIDIWRKPLPMLIAGSYARPYQTEPGGPNMEYLISTAYNASVKAGTKMYSGHFYTSSVGSVLANDMNHARTSKNLTLFTKQIALAKSVGRPYVLGETGFHGLDRSMDATFGGALQVLDKTLRAVTMDIKRVYYHQGTINQAFFNWWSDDQVNAPYYGGFMAALALAQGEQVVAGDAGDTSYAQYVIYKGRRADRVLLINTDYYSGTGIRSQATFRLTNLDRKKGVKAVRMTAASSEVVIDRAQKSPSLTIGGQYFSNTDCRTRGKQIVEKIKVTGGHAMFTLKASEALLIYL